MVKTKGRRSRAAPDDSLGGRVRKIRRGRALTQEQLAARADLSPDVISRVETGQREPQPSTIRKLADALSVEVEYLTGAPAPVAAQSMTGNVAGREQDR